MSLAPKLDEIAELIANRIIAGGIEDTSEMVGAFKQLVNYFAILNKLGIGDGGEGSALAEINKRLLGADKHREEKHDKHSHDRGTSGRSDRSAGGGVRHRSGAIPPVVTSGPGTDVGLFRVIDK